MDDLVNETLVELKNILVYQCRRFAVHEFFSAAD